MGGRGTLGRLLVIVAMIVQIVAPIGSTASMMRLAFDPLVDIIVCAHDQDLVDRRDGADGTARHHGDACELCQLVAPGGHAPPVPAVSLDRPAAEVRHVQWRMAVETVIVPRLLDHIRGRGPPSLS